MKQNLKMHRPLLDIPGKVEITDSDMLYKLFFSFFFRKHWEHLISAVLGLCLHFSRKSSTLSDTIKIGN